VLPGSYYRPPFTLTASVLGLCTELTRLVGRVEGLPPGPPQVTALLEGKRVLGGRREIQEVENALAAYEEVRTLAPARVKDLLTAHGLLMRGLLADAGRFRRGAVGILQGSRVAHVAPPAARVPQQVEQLLGFVGKDRETHPLLKAVLCHYELEFIHPFADGNGRVGRLWQHRLLLDVHPVFEHVPVESVVRARQSAYYDALGASDRAGDATPFVLFALTATRDALADLVSELRPEPATAATRLERARAQFGSRELSRGEYLALFPTMSAPTASRDLRAGVEDGRLVRRGDKATARYRFARKR
jgi:Fic family protein